MSEMLELYIYPFVFFMTVIGFSVLIRDSSRFYFPILVLSISLTLILLLLRNPFSPYDSINYAWMYEEQKSIYNIFNAYHGDYFFSFTQYVGNFFGIEVSNFLIIQSIVFYIISVVGFKLLLKDFRCFLLCICIFSLTSTFVLLYTNVMRQGLALALLLLSFGFFYRRFFTLSIVFSVFSVYSHVSSLLVYVVFAILINLNFSKRTYFIFLVALPLISLLSSFVLKFLGGVTSKIDSLASQEYNNNLVYLKLTLMYISSLLFYWFLSKVDELKNESYHFLMTVYVSALFMSFVFLPVLLISSRYIYYASAFLPILYSIMLCHKNNIINVYTRFFIGMLISFLFGIFVYSFDSTRAQLGI